VITLGGPSLLKTQQITPQKPIFKLFQSFKLQQFASMFAELGYGEDIYKLSMIGVKQRTELMDTFSLSPQQKDKFG
jgi:hypothetical protein